MRTANRFLCFVILLLPLSAYCQSYKKLRVGAGLGFTGFRLGPSMAFYAEPSYRLNDRFVAGLRVETNFRQGSTPVVGSFTLTGQYYFSTTEKTRFFGGLGAGAFSTNTTPLGSCTCDSDPSETVFGFYPRVGLDNGHFTMQLEYNVMQRMTQEVYSGTPSTGPVTYEKANMDYFAFKLGFFVGGGRKEK